MDIAIALLLLWALLFLPLGLVLHWFVLGDGSRVRALPIAPVTGMAFGFVVLSALGRFDVEAGTSWVPWTFVGVSIACGALIWRVEIPWRSRELIGSTLLLLFAVVLVQLPVIGAAGDGPLGYGTRTNPVDEVAAIDAAAHGPASQLRIARQAADSAGDRPIGFEEFAAMTVALGRGAEDSAPTDDARWSAYSLHSAITGMLVALLALPLFAFARARGMGTFGLIVLVPLGVVTPAAFFALAEGSGAAIGAVPFLMAAVFSLLVTRRDRGWWALAMLFGAAAAVSAGPLALLPLVAVGVAWNLLRSSTYEHLSQHDTPVAASRTYGIVVGAVVLAVVGLGSTFGGAGELLAWPRVHESLADAARSWPFVWLDTDLSPDGPRSAVETAVWLIGPALLAMAAIYAVVRNERRELGVLVGSVASFLIALLIAFIDRDAGIRLFEFTALATSPFLAALALRAVALAREEAADKKETARGRWSGRGPTAVVLAFGLLSIAATSVTGTRMVHAPSFDSVNADMYGRTLIAAGDPWLAFVLDGERAGGDSGYADADALASGRRQISDRELTFGGYDSVVLGSSPLASDPTRRFTELGALDPYQVRLFRDRGGATAVARDAEVDRSWFLQQNRTATSDRPAAEAATSSGTSIANGSASAVDKPPVYDIPSSHDPVEGVDRAPARDRPAGLLLPAHDVPGCTIPTGTNDQQPCVPRKPVLGPGCTDRDVVAARSTADRELDPSIDPDSTTTKDAAANADGDDGASGSTVAFAGTATAGKGAARTARKGVEASSAAQGTAAAATKAANNQADPGAPSAPQRPVRPDDPQVLQFDADDELPDRPRLLGVQCFEVDLDDNSTSLLVHLRDVGLILAPERATKVGKANAWDVTRERERQGGTGGVFGGVRVGTSERAARLSYGRGLLNGQFDLVLEGSFGAGVDLSGFPPDVDAQNATTGASVEFKDLPSFGQFRGSANGFSSIARNVQLNGAATVVNAKGTDIELGRMFARPANDMPRSCDVPIAIEAGELREIRTESAGTASVAVLERPGLTVAITDITGEGDSRVAHVAVGAYLSRAGLPRHTLIDWTEQYEDPVTFEACDGSRRTEPGAMGRDQLVTTPDALTALGNKYGADLTSNDT